MEKLSLFAFNVRAFFQSLLYVIIRLFSGEKAKKYLDHIDNVDGKFGIKAIRKEWALVLCEKMRYFALLPDFRRELILSNLNDTFILDMLRSIKPKDLSPSELELIALNRKFDETGTESLYWFKMALFNSSFATKKEAIKIFYKNSKASEKEEFLSEILLKEFDDDFEFICWLALNGGSDLIRKTFLKKLVSGNTSADTRAKLKKFVEEVGLGGCEIEKLGVNELLLDVRQYLTRKEDIDIWEVYLLKSKNPLIIKSNVRRFGIENKEALQLMLELNDKDVIDSYNSFNNSKKLRH